MKPPLKPVVKPASPYLAPGFYDAALAAGKHRDIVGGRWDETGRIQMAMLAGLGLQPSDRFLDIGAGSLRLGCRLVPFLNPGNYWATDASRALMLRGHEIELADKVRLDPAQLIEDSDFSYPGVPDSIDMALAFAVFTHLPLDRLSRALEQARTRLPNLRLFAFTVFLSPDTGHDAPHRQPDGVVTHPDRTPFHHRVQDVTLCATRSDWALDIRADRLPRGQVLCIATPGNDG